MKFRLLIGHACLNNFEKLAKINPDPIPFIENYPI